ncbi:MAG: Na+/H+ antiporter NhaA [Geobacteraceae bacterium GWC2_53_11]|nr:MAG: Na+/H+ antiporter NhaA [Geobacteraceae bacterium GWC2_53_11]
MKTNLTTLFIDFFESEKTSGIILILCTIASITLANSSFGTDYLELWHTKVAIGIGDTFSLKYSLEHWINDGLMAIFFLLIGLEIERELYIGELSTPQNASLPIIAAFGGMVVPALLHFLLNSGTATQGGAGIPMATDIAFALGVLALLGNSVPASLKVYLAALAIIDDLGAILVIALFYQGDFSLLYFVLALGIYAGLLILNRLGVNKLTAYLIPGIFMWYFMLQSGVHATIAGVLLAFAIPFRNGDKKSPSYRLQHLLHKPVAFIIMPLFALANTGIVLAGNWLEGLTSSNSFGIFAGLFLGKPLGITLFSVLAVKVGLSRLPDDVSWRHIIGAGFLGGIGFTMSIFIALLAFGNPETAQSSKISILLGSLAAGTVGFLVLRKQSAHVPGQAG